MHTITLTLDDDDLQSLSRAMAACQATRWAAGVTTAPTGEGPLGGRLLGEVCRGYLDYIDALRSDAAED